MSAPRRKVVTARQVGNSLSGYRFEWTCKLSCGHEARYNVLFKIVPAPKTLQCFECARAAETVNQFLTARSTS